MERRPTWAKNFRRFGFKSLRSHSGAPSWRRNASLAPSLLMEPGLSPEAPCPGHLRVDQGVRSLLCATARRTDKSYDSAGCWKDEPLGAQPLTSEAKENLRSLVLKGPFEPAKLRVLPSPVTGASRSRGVPEPR